MNVNARTDFLDRATDREIGRAVVGRVNAPLQTDFHRAAVRGFDGAPLDLLEAQVVRAAAQILAELAF